MRLNERACRGRGGGGGRHPPVTTTLSTRSPRDQPLTTGALEKKKKKGDEKKRKESRQDVSRSTSNDIGQGNDHRVKKQFPLKPVLFFRKKKKQKRGASRELGKTYNRTTEVLKVPSSISSKGKKT